MEGRRSYGEAKKLGAVFDPLGQSRGRINDATNDAARRIVKEENPNVVRQQLLAAVRLGVETEQRNPVRKPGAARESPVVPRSGQEPAVVPEVRADSGARAGARGDSLEPRVGVEGVDRPPGVATRDRKYAGSIVPITVLPFTTSVDTQNRPLIDTPKPAIS
jgi:hypothetical protein